MMRQEDATSTLRTIVSKGIAIDLFHAHEASSLNLYIGEVADDINRATFGAFFGSIQIILGRFQALSVARLYEAPSKRYTIRSIPTAISMLREHADVLPIEQRPGLEEALRRLGAPKQDVRNPCDVQLTEFVADFF